MPLTPPTPRQAIHRRRITCEGFRRDDGLWDIEGHLVDTKTHPLENIEKTVGPDAPIHEMRVRVTVDDELTIRKVEAVTEHAPFGMCGDVAPSFSALAGLKLANGFSREIRERFGGVKGCTHLVELMGPIATTAFQTIVPYHARRTGKTPPVLVDMCHALASDGPIMTRMAASEARPLKRGGGRT